MTAKNHFLFSVSVVSLTLGTLDPFVLLIAGAMSLLPDIDSSKSVYGKILFPLSRLIERHFPHRTFTHSFFMTAIVAIGTIPLAFESKEFYFAALIGFFCGWFLDVFTKAGVSAFYPMSMARLVIPANPALRLATGSKNEWFFSVIFLALIVISFQLHSSGGVMQIFTLLLAQPTGVSEMVRSHGQTSRIYVLVDGQTTTGNISGKFPVVDLLSNNVFIVRNSENILLTVGDAQCLQCHIRANSVKGVLGETISVRVEEIKLDDKPIGKLISLLEKESGEVLIYGELNLREAEDLRIETSQLQFNPLQISTNLETKTVRFQSASLEDLRRLAKYTSDGPAGRENNYEFMKQLFLVFSICFLCASCQKQATDSPVDTVLRKTITLGADEKTPGENLPESIKVRVQISRRGDLRVKVGDKLKVGDVIADRNKERNALEAQKRQAELSLERLKNLMLLKAEELNKPIMPDASFTEFEANIRRAALLVEAAKRNIELQESRIEEIGKLPFPCDMSKITQHETARLALLKGELLEAESNLALERAKLETTKANRNYAEQKDALEIQKAKITIGEQRVSVETNIAQLEAQVTNLNASIITLSAVRAPFAGTVKKISWEGQTNGEITVVISVDVDDSNSSAK